MAKSLQDVVFAIDGPRGAPWSARQSLGAGFWPPLEQVGSVSVRELSQRFAPAGVALRTLASGGNDAWTHIDRGEVIAGIRDRLRDPGIMRQAQTALCGPFAVLLELARRKPVQFVRGADELLSTGTLTKIGGGLIEADDDLCERPVPSPLSEVEWLYTATIRDAENIMDDVDDAEGIEGITLWGAMADWTRELLGLNSHWETCINSGELDALLTAQDALDEGGVAFFLIDANLLHDGEDDHEEDMHWRAAEHVPGKGIGTPGPLTHSEDDAFPPDHWVVYLGGLTPRKPSESDQIKLRLWSWGREFTLSGGADSFGEYLYAVVTGTP